MRTFLVVLAVVIVAPACGETKTDPDAQQLARINRELALLSERVDALAQRVEQLERSTPTSWLPPITPGAQPAAPDAPLAVAVLLVVTRTGEVTLDGSPVPLAELAGKLANKAENLSDLAVVIEAGSGVPYAAVVEVIDVLKRSGVRRYALATPESATPDTATPDAGPGSAAVGVE